MPAAAADVTSTIYAPNQALPLVAESQLTRVLLEQVPIMLCQCDLQHRYVFANQAYAKRFGVQPSDLIGRSVKDVVGPAAYLKMLPIVDRIYAGETFSGEQHLDYHELGTRVMAMTCTPARDAEGRVCGWIAALNDITDQRRAEDLVQVQSTMLEHTFDGIFVWSFEDGITHWGAGAENLYEIAAGDALGRQPHKLLSTWTRDGIDALHHSLRTTGQWTGELRQSRKEGRELVVESRMLATRHADGRFTVIETNRDITARKRAEEGLRESEARFRHLAESSPLVVWVSDARGECIYVNQRWEELTGQSVESAQGRGWFQCIHTEDRSRVSIAFAEAVSCHDVFRLEYRVRGVNGTYGWVMDSGRPRFGSSGQFLGYVGSVMDITDRRMAEEALRAKERHLRIVTENVPLMLAHCDRHLRYVWTNQRYLQHWNLPEAGVLGQPIEQVLGRASFERAKPQIDRVLAGESVSFEAEVSYPALGKRWITARYAPTRGSDGEVTGWIAALLDVTEQRQKEAALRESQTTLSVALEAAQMGTWDYDLAEGKAHWSSPVAELFGFPADRTNITSEDWRTRIHPEDLPKVDGAFREALQGKRDYDATYRTVWPDGSIHWLQSRGRCYFDDRGVAVRVIGVSFDVTAAQTAEAALRHREHIYRAIGESIDYGIWICDSTGKNIYTSESFLRMTGLTRQECADNGWARVLHPEEAESTLAAWLECTREGTFWEKEHRIKDTDGRWRPVLGRGVPVRDPNTGKIVCWAGINLDISGVKKTEEELRAAKAQLENHAEILQRTVAERTASLQQALEQMEEFSYAVSHDLRAPLRSITGLSEVLLQDHGAQLQPDASDLIRRIHRSSTRLQGLVNDVLNVSRIARQNVELRPVSLDFLVREAINEIGQHRPTARFEVMGILHRVNAHEPLLAQVVSNLLNNAAKFTRPGEAAKVKLWTSLNGKEVMFHVEDQGIGIAPQHQQRIFEMFERVHPDSKYEGSGIGLTIVRKALDRIGGRIGVESDGLTGSRFWVALSPAVEPGN